MQSTKMLSANIQTAIRKLETADKILIGAGAGFSTSAGLTYDGKRFQDNFGDFIRKYGFTDLYSAGFYPFSDPEEHWAFWSRQIWINRYQPPALKAYTDLLQLIKDKNYFVITTNVDHCFQKAGFDKKRLFYTQGDFGLWQCSVPCHQQTYDNEDTVAKMMKQQQNMRVPEALVPFCPRCGKPMSMNLRIDDTFVEDAGWHEAAKRYRKFTDNQGSIVYLELGVGENTPSIIKYPFWEMTRQNPRATYIPVNISEPLYPKALATQTVPLAGDIGAILTQIKDLMQSR